MIHEPMQPIKNHIICDVLYLYPYPNVQQKDVQIMTLPPFTIRAIFPSQRRKA